MRIVHILFSLKLGGIETMLADIVRQQSLNADVSVVAINNEINESVLTSFNERADVICLNRPPSSKNPWYLIRLHRILRRLKPDIIHTHQENVINMLFVRNVPIVATIHDTGIRQKGTFHKYSRIFAISEAVKQDIQSRYPGTEITVVHNGIDFSRISPKKYYGGTPFRIVQVGSLIHSKKGQDLLLRAFQRASAHLCQGALLIDFIGEGASRKPLENLAAELGIRQWCRFLGLRARHEVYDCLHMYDLLVQPSRYEGFGLTVVEAMSAKVPVLVSDIEGPMEIIENGRYGFFFKSNSPEDCGDKIIELMELSRGNGFANKMDEAREYARSRFSIEATTKQYFRQYNHALRHGNHS